MFLWMDAAGIRPDDESLRGDVFAAEQPAGGFDADGVVHHVVVFHGFDVEFVFQGGDVCEAANGAADQRRLLEFLPEDAEYDEHLLVPEFGKSIGAGNLQQPGPGDAAAVMDCRLRLRARKAPSER